MLKRHSQQASRDVWQFTERDLITFAQVAEETPSADPRGGSLTNAEGARRRPPVAHPASETPSEAVASLQITLYYLWDR